MGKVKNYYHDEIIAQQEEMEQGPPLASPHMLAFEIASLLKTWDKPVKEYDPLNVVLTIEGLIKIHMENHDSVFTYKP